MRRKKNDIENNALSLMTLDKLNSEIDRSLIDSKNDNVIKAIELKKRFKTSGYRSIE